MADANAKPDFRPLEDSYKMVGELRGSGSTRRFVATRNQDGASVMVSIAGRPADAENHELSHYAADAKLLASLHHPSVLAVFDGRWIGDNFAVVTERPNGNTLQDELDRGAEFRNPRIAAVLQDIWSGLEAARELGVVHRAVTPDSVYFDSTKRVVVAFSPTAIPMSGDPGAAADARTIGVLAWAMLTGAPYDPSKPDQKLSELAPNLATRVIEAVERMVHVGDRDDVPDVATALGVIAAGDVLKQGEIEIQATKEEYEERHRQELEKCENHRMETEQFAAEQAALIKEEREGIERLASEQATAFAAERAEIEKFMKLREERIISLRVDLEKQAARAARGLDVEAAASLDPPPPKSSTPRSTAKRAAIAAVLVLLVAASAIGIPRLLSSRHAPATHTTIVPSGPTLDTTQLKRGGFMSQSAGGSIAQPRSGPPLASPHDTLPTTPRNDSVAADSAAHAARASDEPVPKPKPRLAPREPANDVNGAIPPASARESLPVRPDTTRPDTISRPDTMYGRGTPVPRDTSIPRDTLRSSAPMTRGDTTFTRSPNVRVETTYVKGTVRRDSTVARPPQ
jgi:hypothetical protein